MKASTSRFALNNSDNRPSQSQLNTSLKNRSLGEALKTSLSITTSPSTTNPIQVQNNGNHSINVDVQGSGGSPHCDLELDDSVVVKREGALITDLLYKLHRRSTTLVDTHVICQDGFIPVHRCVLMACSKFLMELLIHEDPAELASVCLPDYKICQVLPLINSLYTGCTVFKKSELNSVIEIITLLQADVTYSFQPARELDKRWAPKMRHYVEKKGSRNQHQQQGGTTCVQNQRRLNQFNVGASPSHIDLSQVSPSSSTTSSSSSSPPMTLKVTNVRGGYTVGKDTNPSKSNYSCIGGLEDDDDHDGECDQEQELGSAIEVDIEEIDDPSVSHMNGEDSQYEDIGVEVASEDEFEIVEIITDDQDEDLDGEDVTEIPTVSTTLSRRTTMVKQNSIQSSVDPFDDDRVFSPTIDLVNNVIVRPDIHDLTNRDDDQDEDDERDPLELESLVYDENFEEVPVTQSAFPGRSAVEFETITFDEDGQHKQIAQIITEPLPFGAWKTTSDPASQSTSKANSNFNTFKSPRSPKKTNSKSRGGGRGALNSCPPYQRQTRHHAAELKRLEQMRVDAEHNKSTRLVSSRRPRSIERSDQLKEEHRSRKEDLRFMDQLQQQIRLSLESQIASEDLQEAQSQPPIVAPAGPNIAEQNHVYDFIEDENDANSSSTSSRMAKSKDNEQTQLQMFEIEAKKEAMEKQRRVQIEEERLLKLHQIVEQRKIEQDIERQRKLEEKRQKQEAQRRKKLETDKQNKLDEVKRLQAEQERKQKLEEEKRLKLEAEKIKKLEEEKRLQAEQEMKEKIAEEQRAKLEAEKLKKLEEEKLFQAEQEKRQKLKEEKRLKTEADKRQKLEKDSLRKAEEEKRKLAEEEKRIKLEEERRIKLEEEKRLKLEEEKRLKAVEEKRLKLEEEKRLKLEEEKRLKREEEARKKLEEEKRKKIEKEKQLKAEKLRKQEEEKRLQIEKAEQRKKDEEARLLKIEEDKRLEAERIVREQEESEQRQRDEEARLKLEAERLIQEEENRKKQEEQDKINAARKELERLEEAKRVEEELSLQIERDMQKARSDYESSANLENNSSSSSDATLFNQEQLKRPPKSTKFYEEFVEKKRRLLEAQRTQELLAILEGDRSKDKCLSSTDQSNPVEDGSDTSHTTVITVPDQQSIINSKMCHVSATSSSLDVFASIAAEAPAMESSEEVEIAADGNVTNIAVVRPVADDTPVEMKSPSAPVTAPEPESEPEPEIQPEVEQEVVDPGHNMETTTIEYEEQTVEVDLSSSGASESFDSASVPYEIVEDIPVAENEVILSGDFDYSTEETVVENEVEVETECADIQEEVEVGGSIDSTVSGNPADRADIGSDQNEIAVNISSPTPPPSTSDPLESPANEKESEPTESVTPVSCQDDVLGAARKFLSVNSIQISVNEDPVEDGIEQEKDRDDEEVDETETFSEAATTDDTASAASSGSKSLGRKIKKKRGKKVREKHTQTKPHHTTTTSPTARTTQLTVSLQKLPGDSKLIPNQKQDSVIVHTDEVEKEQEKPEKIKITARRRSSQIENKTGNASSTASRTPQSGVQLLSLSAAAHALSRHPKRIFTTRINGQNYDLSNPKVVISRVSKRVIKKYHRQSQKHSGHTHPALPLLTPAAIESKGAKKWKRLSEEFRSATKGEKNQQSPQILKSSIVSEYYDGSRFGGPTTSGSKKQFPEHEQSAPVEPEDGSPPKLKPQVPSPPLLKQKRSSAPVAAVTPVAINNFPAVSKPAYITYNDLDWYQKELKRCAHCKNKYSVHTKATTCLMSHGFRRCLICLDLMSNLDASYEQHYIKFHSVRHQKGSVACPICGKILMIRGLQLHVTKKHMQQKVDVGHKLPFEIPKFQIQPQQQPSQPQFYGSAIETPFYQNPSGQLPFSAPAVAVEPYPVYPQHPTFIPQSVDQILHPKQQSVVLPSIPSLVLKKMQGSGNEVQLTSSEDDDGGETESQTTEDEDDVQSSRNNNYKTIVRGSNNSPTTVSILKEKSVNESPKDGRNGSNLSPGMYAFKEHRGTQGEVTQQYSAPLIDEDMARKAFLPISITPLPFDVGISNPQNEDGNSNNSNSSQKSIHNQQNQQQQQQQQNLQSQQQPSAVEPQYVDQTITLQTQEITVSQLHIERTPVMTTESQQQQQQQQQHQQHHENQQQQQHHSQQQQQQQQQHSQNQHSSSHYNHHSHASQQQQQAQLSMKRQGFYPFQDIVQPKKRLIHQYNEPPSNYEYGRKHAQPYGEHSNHIPPYYSMPPPAHSLPIHYSQSTEHHSSFMHRTSSHHLHPHAFPPPPSSHSQHHSHHGSQLLPSHGHGLHSHHGHGHHSQNQHHGGHGHSSSNDFPIINPNITVDASGSVMCELSPVNYAASHQYNSNGPKALQALADMYGKGNSNQNSNSINSSRPHKSLFATPPLSGISIANLVEDSSGNGSGGSNSGGGLFEAIIMEEETSRRQQLHQQLVWDVEQQGDSQGQQGGSGRGSNGGGNDGGRGGGMQRNESVINLNMDYLNQNLESMEDSFQCDRCNGYFNCSKLLAEHVCRY